jgi:L-seryl-tRNA(Ser) seleniumtransferase
MNNLRNLPKIDKLLAKEELINCNPLHVKPLAQKAVDELRSKLQSGEIENFDEETLILQIKAQYDALLAPSLVPLVNATGVIVHTNLGRSCLSPELLKRAHECLSNYTNLEYDLENGCRGERYAHVSRHLQTLLGVEDVLVVNNNASAVFLILNTFALGKESIVSRGELVEIGGSFRVPDVMARSGSKLIEVGTTNKTRIGDYEAAITDETAMLMKVHRSNFSIEGFSEEASMEDITKLAQKRGILDYYDLGSGYITPLPYGLSHAEPSLHKILSHNPALVSFSGDKLLGGVQAGIIVGKKSLIQALKKNQLLRMLRVDKLTLALLEESAKAYLNDELHLIPTIFLLNRSIESLEAIAKRLRRKIGAQKCEILHSQTYVGGGTMPNRPIPTVALHVKGNAKNLERQFRAHGAIGRIESDRFLLDLRALLPESQERLVEIAKKVLG